MWLNIRALFDSLSFPDMQLNARHALLLDERSDRIPPTFKFPNAGNIIVARGKNAPEIPKDPKAKDLDAPPRKADDKAAPSTPAPAPPPGPTPAPSTVTITSISTSIITSTVNVTQNITWHDLATEVQSVTLKMPTTLHTTVTANQTLTTTLPAATHTISAKPVPEKKVSTAGVLAVVSGVMNLALLVMMFVLVRRFYRMYRAERVLRKQTQTEGIELAQSKVGGGEKKDDWEL
ncbi:hypothetical protein P7C71_g1400, partial [Lecanoromycetidae sp. Uapishka_2]